LSAAQLRALPKNLDQVPNNPGDLVHQDEHAGHAADAYAALIGDLEYHSREPMKAFWSRLLPNDIDA